MLKEFFINAASLAILIALGYLSNLIGDLIFVSGEQSVYKNKTFGIFISLLLLTSGFTVIRCLLVSSMSSENKQC